jgi:hypothetical protein
LGKDSKACKDSKRLFVTVVDDPGEIYLLQIPQSSCKNLTNLGVRIRAGVKNASGQIVRFPMQAYQVRFSMDEDADFPIVQFSIDKVLDKEAYDEMMKLKELRPWASAEEQAASWYE